MFWIRTGLQSISISDWLTAGPAIAADPQAALDAAREAMLDALGETGARRCARLALRIHQAPDARSLWSLRPELMMVAAQVHGEAKARQRLARVTSCFEGLLPEAAPAGRPRPRRAGAPR